MIKTNFKNYDDAIDFITNGLAKSGGKVFKGESGLEKTRRFMKLLGNPQDGLKAIHIAGTSGKGTTANMIRAILHEHGFTTGLIVSPHSYDIRERYQINNKLISKKELLSAINASLPAILDRFLASEAPTYFQVNTAIGFMEMQRNKVDYSIVETGLGGLYDSTNVLDGQDKVCVITRLGKDHQKILGDTYSQIAMQKAGIIKHRNLVISFKQRVSTNKVIADYAELQKARLTNVDLKEYRKLQKQIQNPTLSAGFQLENISLAVETCRQVAGRDNWVLYSDKVTKALNNLSIPARFDTCTRGGRIYIFDGAHNPQKLSALASQYSLFQEKKATIIMALKNDKAAYECIKALAPIASDFIFTRFLEGQDFASFAHDPNQLTKLAQKVRVKSRVASSEAHALSLVSNSHVLITGSNYHLGEIRELLDN